MVKTMFIGGGTISYFNGQVAPTPLNTDGANWTVNFSPAPQAGDYVVVGYTANGAFASQPTIGITTSGYTEIGTITFVSSTISVKGGVFAKFMGGTPDSSVTMTGTGNVFSAGAVYISIWRNVNTSTPMDVAVQIATGIDTWEANPPSITPISAGAVIVCIGMGGVPPAQNETYTSSDLTDFLSENATDTRRAVVGGGYKLWTGGAFDAATFGLTGIGAPGVGQSWLAYSIALRPA